MPADPLGLHTMRGNFRDQVTMALAIGVNRVALEPPAHLCDFEVVVIVRFRLHVINALLGRGAKLESLLPCLGRVDDLLRRLGKL